MRRYGAVLPYRAMREFLTPPADRDSRGQGDFWSRLDQLHANTRPGDASGHRNIGSYFVEETSASDRTKILFAPNTLGPVGLPHWALTKETIVKRYSMGIFGASLAAILAAATLGAGAAQAHDPQQKDMKKTVTLSANLTELNHSGASGTATAVIRNQKIKHIEIHADGLSPNAPHAQHIHYGNQALNECPTLAQDADGNGRINTVEGVPAYGPVVVSLTTNGDTSPASVLDVARFPVSADGSYHYSRSNIQFTKVAGTGYPRPDGAGTAKDIADSIRNGEGVIVIHGVDYNGNGSYDFEAGASELDPNLPSEATDPAACGILQ